MSDAMLPTVEMKQIKPAAINRVRIIQEYDKSTGTWSAKIQELDNLDNGWIETLLRDCKTQIQAAAAGMEIFNARGHNPHKTAKIAKAN